MEPENQGTPPQPNQRQEAATPIEQLISVLRNFMQQTRNEPASASATHVPVDAPGDQPPHVASIPTVLLPPEPYESTLPDFIKCNRYFDGAFGKPDEAEDWLAQIERSFRAFEVPQRLRLAYGTYMLTFNARIWWESKSRELLPPITWETFRHEFLENFFPGSLRVQYSADFLCISQGSRSIEQYETEFSRLLQYAPESYKHSEELKRQVFLNGLNEDLRVRLEEFDIRSFGELVERARIVESARKRRRGMIERKAIAFEKEPFCGISARTEFKVHRPANGLNEEKNSTMEDIQCWKCKKKHYPMQCPRLQSKCYLCGNPNHRIQNCPKKTTTTCYICIKTGHLANQCPGRNNPHIKSFRLPKGKGSYNKDGSHKGNRNRDCLKTSSPKIRMYNLQGQWVREEDNGQEIKIVVLDNDAHDPNPASG